MDFNFADQHDAIAEAAPDREAVVWFVFRDSIARSPSGKADSRWAKAQAEEG